MAVLTDIVIDSADPPRLAAFWAEMLDGYAVLAYTVMLDPDGNEFCVVDLPS